MSRNQEQPLPVMLFGTYSYCIQYVNALFCYNISGSPGTICGACSANSIKYLSASFDYLL